MKKCRSIVLACIVMGMFSVRGLAKTIEVVPSVPGRALTTWYFSSCTTSLGAGTYTMSNPPSHGAVAFDEDSGPVPGCPVGSPSLPASAADYTWTDTTLGIASDYFQLQYILGGQIRQAVD